MRAAVLKAPLRLDLETVADPEPAPDEVVVRVSACGVCGTDRAIYRDEYPVHHPLIMGHEYAGTVVALGAQASAFAVGSRVVVDPNIVDDDCYFCRHGVDHLCSGLSPLGVARPGGFAEFSAVPERYAYALPPSLPLEIGSQVEPVACCVHGIDRAQIATGDIVVVSGSGPIGCILIQLARLQGAAQIVAIDPNPARRALAEGAGADIACAPDGVASALAALRPGAGADVVIEASGSASAAEAAFGFVRRGGTILLFAVYPEAARLSVSPFRINEDELRIAGTLNNPHTHQRAIDLLASRRVELGALITDVLALDELERAMDIANFPQAGKIVIQPSA